MIIFWQKLALNIRSSVSIVLLSQANQRWASIFCGTMGGLSGSVPAVHGLALKEAVYFGNLN